MQVDTESKLKPVPTGAEFARTSVLLQRLHDDAPTGHFTLAWLLSSLGERSYGMIMLLLATVAIAPGVCIVSGLLLMIPAMQMLSGRPAPVFPRRIADRPLPRRYLDALVQRAVPVLKFLEKFIHPRWSTPVEPTRRVVGTVVMLLSIALVLAPIPLSNVVPAVVMALISLAYLAEDGLLLALAMLAAVVVLTLAVGAVWEAVLGAKWLGGVL